MLDASAIRQSGLAGDVATVVRNAILSGDLASGQHIVERDLAAQLGLSRGPIRDALRQLESEGLVEIAPRRGARVAVVGREDARVIMALREAIEPVAVRFALERGDQVDLGRLEEIVAELKVASENEDWAAANRLDVEFHGTLYELSGSRRLARIWEMMRAPLLQAFQHHRHVYSPDYSAYDSHRQLYEVLRSGDVAAAEEAVRRHVGEFADEVIQMLPEGE